MEQEKLAAMRDEISEAMKKLTDQYTGKVSMIEELIALQVKEQKGEEVAPDA